MPVSLVKRTRATTLPPTLLGGARGVDPETNTLLISGLDPTNRTTRTPLGWITDASPSLEGFTHSQLESAKLMVDELRAMPATARSVVMNIVQLDEPAIETGFHEIAKFTVPPLHVVKFTPLHAALGLMTSSLGSLCSELRDKGIDRTDSVVIITTDGFANHTTADVIAKSIEDYLGVCKKWSVTNIVVGVGEKLNEPLLKMLANVIPPLQIEKLNAEMLTPFIQNIAKKVSVSRKGQKVEIELSEGIRVLGE